MPIDYSRPNRPSTLSVPGDPVKEAFAGGNFFERQAKRLQEEERRYTKNTVTRFLHRAELKKIRERQAFVLHHLNPEAATVSKKAAEPQDDGPEL